MKARYFDSGLARFLAVDPASGSARAQSPQSWNRYAYAGNNPIRYIDPDGEDLQDAVEFLDGVVRGVTASISNGAYPGAGPRASDSTSSLQGQAIGSAVVGVVGAIVSAGGAVGGIVTSPTGAGAVAGGAVAVAGATAVVGAGNNLAEISKEAGSRDSGTTKEVVKRDSPGADGGSSQHIIEKDADGQTISVTHQASNAEGEVVHQHQTHVGKHGTQRQFPDEWVEHPSKDK